MTRLLLFALTACFVSCGKNVAKPTEKTETAVPAGPAFVLQSPAFPDNAPIPDKYTGKGEDISPTLTWTNTPAQTKSLALIMDDPDAPGGTFTHWLIYNLITNNGGLSGLAEGVQRGETVPGGARQLKNDAGEVGYSGPMPPPGKLHHYHFTLFALDRMLSATLVDRQQLQAALNGHILAQTRLTGTYQR